MATYFSAIPWTKSVRIRKTHKISLTSMPIDDNIIRGVSYSEWWRKRIYEATATPVTEGANLSE